MKNKLALLLILLSASCYANTDIRRTTDGVLIRSACGFIKLRVIRDDIVQIVKFPTNQIPCRKSLSEVDGLKCDAHFSIREKDQAVTLTTRKIRVQVPKK